MTTTRLYYDDAYLSHFDARIIDRGEIDGRYAVALDRTAFYPNGGGQPGDHGTLDKVAVVDVRAGNGIIWHLLDQPLEVAAVQGRVNWRRRWDHMQNHSGQHILSQAFVVAAGASTVAWRLSENTLTVDLDRAVGEEQLAEAERLANDTVQEDRPIRSRIVDESELAGLALRKQPDVDGPLRIVEIEGFDRVACGGTHVDGTAQVGLVKVLRTERRGVETRVHFVCGGRALGDYARKHLLVRGLAGRLTCSEDELFTAVQRLQDESQANFKALKAALQTLVEAEAERLWAQVSAQAAPRLICGAYPTWDEEQVKALALALKRQPGCFIAIAGGRSALVIATRSADQALDAGQFLRAALSQVGGRGGGRPDYAQGSAPTLEAAQQAIELIARLVQPKET